MPPMQHEHRLRAILLSAEAHTRAGRLRRAVRAYRRVLSLAPAAEYQHELAQARLADLHLALHEHPQALSHLLRAEALADQPEADYALMRGAALVAAGRTTEAELAYHDALACPRRAPSALRALARLFAARGDRSGARHLASLAEARAPEPHAHRSLARELADA
jgi:Flp pilus assembly protein TadD